MLFITFLKKTVEKIGQFKIISNFAQSEELVLGPRRRFLLCCMEGSCDEYDKSLRFLETFYHAKLLTADFGRLVGNQKHSKQ